MQNSSAAPLACVNAPALPLQLLLARHPSWAEFPVAVVDRDSPQGVIQWVNRPAFRLRILPGLRYGEGLSLNSTLRADVVSDAQIQEGVQELTGCLANFTPDVEPAPDLPGVFWLNAAGLTRLYPSQQDWTERILRCLQEHRFHARVAAGYTRFRTFAATTVIRQSKVFVDADEEARFADHITLDRLSLEPKLRDALDRLGVKTVGDFLALPPGGLRNRFGAVAHRLYQVIEARQQEPLQPVRPHLIPEDVLHLDFSLVNTTTLVFLIKRRLSHLLKSLSQQGEALQALEIRLHFDRGAPLTEVLRPATPTLEMPLILHLVALRLEATKFPGGVEALRLQAHGAPASKEQLLLFRENPDRNLLAADRALARIRAEFGDRAVQRARLVDRHLPEASFQWEPLLRLAPADLEAVVWKPTVRRIGARPIALPSPPRHRHDNGWLIAGLESGTVVDCQGPYLVSGGWWRRSVQRAYHYALTQNGDLLWVFYDQRRRRWFLQGRIE